MKFFGGAGRGQSGTIFQILVTMWITIRIRSSWMRVTVPIPELFKVFFIYYCDFYRQPTVKHDILGGGLNFLRVF